MYSYKITSKATNELNNLVKSTGKESVLRKIEQLKDNPEKIAKPTPKKVFGDYYVNCGNKYACVFNINKEDELIEIYAVKSQPYLYKVFTGRLNVPTDYCFDE